MSTIKSGKAGHKSWVSKKSHQIGETLLDSGLEFWVGSILFLWSYPRVRFTTRKDRERGGGPMRRRRIERPSRCKLGCLVCMQGEKKTDWPVVCLWNTREGTKVWKPEAGSALRGGGTELKKDKNRRDKKNAIVDHICPFQFAGRIGSARPPWQVHTLTDALTYVLTDPMCMEAIARGWVGWGPRPTYR